MTANLSLVSIVILSLTAFCLAQDGVTLVTSIPIELSTTNKTNETVIDCGGPQWFYFNASFTSLNYPNNYEPNMRCEYYLVAEPGKRVVLYFDDFDVESGSGNCLYDGLELWHGSHLWRRLCNGKEIEFEYASTANVVKIVFYTDDVYSRRGFSAHFYSMPFDMTSTIDPITNMTTPGQIDCGGQKTLRGNGTFSSINYPNDYVNNMNCEWVLHANGSKMVSLRFVDFELEASRTCSYDYVDIRDGPFLNSPLLDRLCGNATTNRVFNSTGRSLYVRMKTDGSITARGFQAQFHSVNLGGSSGCGGPKRLTGRGQFTSLNYPNNYIEKLQCEWVLKAQDHQQKVVVHIRDFWLERDDFLEFREGDSSSSRFIARLTGRDHPNGTIESEGRFMHVVFKSNSHFVRRGFLAVFRSEYPEGTIIPGPLPSGTLAGRFGFEVPTFESGSRFLQRTSSQLIRTGFQKWFRNKVEKTADKYLINLHHDDIERRVHISHVQKDNDKHRVFISGKFTMPPLYKEHKMVMDHDRLYVVFNQLVRKLTYHTRVNMTFGSMNSSLLLSMSGLSVEHRLPQNLFEICTFFDYCGAHQKYTHCADDGSNSGTKRCQCFGPYVAARDLNDTWFKCHKWETSYTEPHMCPRCERNGGTCFKSKIGRLIDRNRTSHTGCSCPNTKGGAFCERNYVHVECRRDRMNITFQPFDDSYADFFYRNHSLAKMLVSEKPYLPPKASIHFKNRKNYPGCIFKKQPNQLLGSYNVSISTHDDELGVCGTRKYKQAGRLFYQNTVVVDVPDPIHSVSFNVFCSFQETVRQGSGTGLGVKLPILGEAGHWESAKVDMSIRDINNRILGSGARVYENDQLFVRFKLTDSKGVFHGISVSFCTASSRRTLGNPSATTLPLLQNGCPAPGQNYLTAYNNFQRVGGDPTVVQNRPYGIPAFRLDNSDSFFIHCKINVSRSPVYFPPRCGSAAQVGDSHRVKRSAAEEAAGGTIDLTHQFVVLKRRGIANHEQQKKTWIDLLNEPKWFLPIAGTLCVLLLVLILVVSTFGYKLLASAKDKNKAQYLPVPTVEE